MRLFIILIASLLISHSVMAAGGWNKTRNILDDVIYAEYKGKLHKTFYCGCEYRSKFNDDGSGEVFPNKCMNTHNSPPVDALKWNSTAVTMDVEHVVSASLMPARNFSCWDNGSRTNCEKNNPKAQAMIFDLHNLVPSVGQVNRARSNDRYGELKKSNSRTFAGCKVKDQKSPTKQNSAFFEPPDCKKGDVARIWLYMHQQHGVYLISGERKMFEKWSKADPISPWEKERERRIFNYSRVMNPFVHGKEADPAGACPWEEK